MFKSRTAFAPGALAVALVGGLIYSAAAQDAPPGQQRSGGPFSLEGVDLSPKPPVPHKRPDEEQQLIQLQPGYEITPVLADPQIQQPGAISFDADGRMYVLELRTYMLDADAKDELAPRSRISRWEDKDGDGIYETGTVFADNLVFPRFITPMGKGQLIVKESNSDDTFLYTDTNGDGKADKKELFVTGLGRSGNVEHQESHLTSALDNWMYSTYNSVRVRWTPTGVKKEQVGSNGAAWGVSQDDYGKTWFQGGASGLPSYFQFPIQYGTIVNPNALQEGFRTPWGAPIGLGDMQGGLSAVRPGEGSLNAATAGAGANVFRGDRLPAELRGDYFYGEVVARVLRRSHPVNIDGLTQVQNPYQAQKGEFVRSMDPLFRPVDNKTAPDGTIYIVDMYHGIIQEGEWAQPGSYLRAKINQHQLDKAVGLGRIWRLTYKGMARDTTRPRMFEETSAQLVAHLTHPNGWWRDTAQQQLVLRQDKSVVPALKTMARSNRNELARIHALWTLEGLNALDAALVRPMMKDPSPKIRAQAIRASESLYKAGDRSFAEDYKAAARDADVDVSIQALLTLNYLKAEDTAATVRTVQAANSAKGVQLVSNFILNPPVAAAGFNDGDNPPVRTTGELATLARGQELFSANCGECHGADGQGAPDGGGGLMAPALAGNLRLQGSPEHVLRVMLSGLTDPIDGRSYAAGAMAPQRQQNDEWIAAVASFLRNGMTNGANMVTPDMVGRVRDAEGGRATPYTDAHLKQVEPRLVPSDASWKVTASHNASVIIGGTGHPAGALNLEGWTTGEPQKPGMWFQVELPRTVNLAGLDYQALISAAFAPPRPAPGAVAPATPAPAPAAPGAGFQRPPRSVYFPRGFKVEVSTDGRSWKTVKEGQGSSMYNSLLFDPTPARFVRFTTTSAADVPWGMRYLKLYEKPTG